MGRDEMGPSPKDLISRAKKGEVQATARLLTHIENDLAGSAQFLAQLKENKNSIRIGITGPPGAGKSSLINLLLTQFRQKKLRVAVLAVDPSSPFSGGAILGDRIRMSEHHGDRDIFIRSIGSRGGLGGLSSATGAMAMVLEAVGFDVVIIETVGVGQTELEVMNLADATAVVLVPESGDVIQTIKAGILEIADLFIVNKCDRPGSEILAKALHALVEQEGETPRDILQTSVIKKIGLDELSNKLIAKAKTLKKARRHQTERIRGELRNLILWTAGRELDKKLDRLFAASKVDNVYTAFQKLQKR